MLPSKQLPPIDASDPATPSGCWLGTVRWLRDLTLTLVVVTVLAPSGIARGAEPPETERAETKETAPAAKTINAAFAPLEWLIGDWQAEFRPLGDDQPAPTMSFEWGDDRRSFLRMIGTQPTPDGLVPEYESMAVWHPVRQKFVFLSAYQSAAGRVVEDGDIDLHEDGSVQLNMRVHYPAGMALPFTDGAKAGPDGHTLEFRRTFHREGEDGLRGVFRIRRGEVWENPHPELKMDDGYPWRRVGAL